MQIQVWLKLDKNSDALHEDLSMFYIADSNTNAAQQYKNLFL